MQNAHLQRDQTTEADQTTVPKPHATLHENLGPSKCCAIASVNYTRVVLPKQARIKRGPLTTLQAANSPCPAPLSRPTQPTAAAKNQWHGATPPRTGRQHLANYRQIHHNFKAARTTMAYDHQRPLDPVAADLQLVPGKAEPEKRQNCQKCQNWTNQNCQKAVRKMDKASKRGKYSPRQKISWYFRPQVLGLAREMAAGTPSCAPCAHCAQAPSWRFGAPARLNFSGRAERERGRACPCMDQTQVTLRLNAAFQEFPSFFPQSPARYGFPRQPTSMNLKKDGLRWFCMKRICFRCTKQ